MRGRKRVIIVGGGAAGIFAAAVCAENAPHLEVIVLEKTAQLLSKVRISGGGRCNVTHSQFDPKKLTQNYPRGHRELVGPFHRFQPQDTITWFARHGVELKTEEDGRMFPVTDHSATVIHCLLDAAKKGGVQIRNEHSVRSLEKMENGFRLHLERRDPLDCDDVILATGSHASGHALAAQAGHTIIPPVPSLFSFNVPSSPLLDLAGIAVADAELSLNHSQYKQRGNLLLTHWGFSGPAALKLSAWAARDLHESNYLTPLIINWVPSLKTTEVAALLFTLKKRNNNPGQENPFHLPMNLWKRLLTLSEIPPNSASGHLPDKKFQLLSERLTRSCFAIEGKTPYKAEFVTCGGVHLKEVDFKTMESHKTPHLFFAGEILDIDGVTGGFNFQNAWTTAFLAASCIAQRKPWSLHLEM